MASVPMGGGCLWEEGVNSPWGFLAKNTTIYLLVPLLLQVGMWNLMKR